MIISLTGFMGSGKSRISAELNKKLGWEVVDLDRYIEYKTGRSIPELFANGESSFRAIEADALRDQIMMHKLTGENLILSLGGGTICIGAVRPLILEESLCIYLRARVETLEKRLANQKTGRPLLKTHGISELLAKRDSVYSMAGAIIDTDDKTPEQIADEIIKLAGI